MALYTLPTELIHAISTHLELRDHLFLCRASSRMQMICVKRIYRVLDLKSPVQLLQCFKTIIARPKAATSVRELSIRFYCPDYTLKSFHTMLRSAAARMENLLVISVRDTALLRSISDIAFVRLTDCSIPLSLDSYPFLGRNPTIEYVALLSLPSQTEFLSNIQPIRMPKLEHFVGPECAVYAVVPYAPVSTLSIWWMALEYSRGLTAAASSKAELCELVNAVSFWDPALPRAIAKHTPRIQSLHIRGLLLSGLTPDKENFLSAIDDVLSSLTCLVELVVWDDTPPIDSIGDAFESEFDRIRKWGDICPTLIFASLTRTWARFGVLWLPERSGTETEWIECLKWLIKKALNRRQSPSCYCAVVADLEKGFHLVGSDEMQVLADAAVRGEALPAFDLLVKEDGRPMIVFPSDS
ncbi:hypothetical protein MSAN_00217100 [Mycena sanguinolenta]|uniref:F-box domain-containing protein n=1 Tax=Mycena sanguinolenta TaxID=230812 RepID=A0A8H6ZIC9_9AGAR|nr:hypothetical protein MSAN_00217100 [Mycena sanguinolenta]